jgi:hypothetical protein
MVAPPELASIRKPQRASHQSTLPLTNSPSIIRDATCKNSKVSVKWDQLQFRKMLDSGYPPGDWDELLAQAKALPKT